MTTPTAPAGSTPQPICFVDVETDGLHQGKQAWEIAIIRRDHAAGAAAGRGGYTETTLHVMLPMLSMRTSDPFALNVGGFWDRHPSGRELSGKDPIPGPGLTSTRRAAEAVFRLTFGAHIVGVNPAFDVEVLTTLLRGEGLIPRWDYHLGDLVAQTVGYLQGILKANSDAIHPKVYPAALADVVALPWKSDELAAAVGVDPASETDRHTALGDALWAKRWYDTLHGIPQTEGAVA